MVRKIGIETSSIMPLLEITPRTLQLQEGIKEAISKEEIEFYTDLYTIKEATQQIYTSFTNAVKSIEKAKSLANLQNIHDPEILSMIFVKCLAENWYGREETLRWSDVITNRDLQTTKNNLEFFRILSIQLENKRRRYDSMLKIKDHQLIINCKDIQPYWITPKFLNDLTIKINIIQNRLSIEEFFQKLQLSVSTVYVGRLKINDVVDIYHLYSLYFDSEIKEIWSCNQQFVKRHKEYLQSADEFRNLFDSEIVTIKRIK